MSKIKVRVWLGTVGDEAVMLDVGALLDSVGRIWQQAGVGVTRHREVRTVALSPIELGVPATDAEAQIVGQLAGPINQEIRGQGTDPHLDLVLLPLFSHWGKAYTPLTPAGAKSSPSFAPFEGLVAIVTTAQSITGDKSWLSRTAKAWPLGHDAPPPVNPLGVVAAANDLAHEIGHLFGLWHTTHDGRPGQAAIKAVPRQIQYLIHETVYNQIAKLHDSQNNRARTEQEARTILAKSSPDAENATLGRDAEWYVGLRGEQVDPMDLTIVQQNIDSGRHLSGR